MSIERLSSVLVKAAEVATMYPEYICLYERIEREYVKRVEGETILQRALKLAGAASQNVLPTV